MLEVAYYAVSLGSYEQAEDFLKRQFNATINDDTVRKVVNLIGRYVYLNDCKNAESAIDTFCSKSLDFSKNRDGVLYLETDGSLINTRSKDKNGSAWKENKIGIAFNSDDIYKWKNKKGEICQKIDKREYICIFGSVDEFKKHFLYLALKNGYGKFKKTVIISDGATWIRNINNELFPDSQQILDYFHLCENTSNYCKSLFSYDNKTCKNISDRWCQLLKKGKWELVLKEIEQYRNNNIKSDTINLYNYIINNCDNINYPEYISNGFFIGSGAIESANKTVVQSRLKLSGMRWNQDCAQYVLSLKAKSCSNKWFEVVNVFRKYFPF